MWVKTKFLATVSSIRSDFVASGMNQSMAWMKCPKFIVRLTNSAAGQASPTARQDCSGDQVSIAALRYRFAYGFITKAYRLYHATRAARENDGPDPAGSTCGATPPAPIHE